MNFKEAILQGIPEKLPEPKPYDPSVNHAPKRKDILTIEEKKLAVKNALRYFPKEWHDVLAPEFKEELEKRPSVKIFNVIDGTLDNSKE
jgi:urocanate hydratase